MVYILSFLIDIVIINIPKFAFSILKMQYFNISYKQFRHDSQSTVQNRPINDK